MLPKEITMSKFNENVAALAEKLKGHITYADKKLSVSPDAYIQTLPEGLTAEQANAFHEHHSVLFPAVTLATGQVSQGVMEKDKDIANLGLEFPMVGKDHFSVIYNREQTFPNPAGGDPITKYGTVKTALVTQSAIASRGEMNKVRDFLSTEALKAFAGE